MVFDDPIEFDDPYVFELIKFWNSAISILTLNRNVAPFDS